MLGSSSCSGTQNGEHTVALNRRISSEELPSLISRVIQVHPFTHCHFSLSLLYHRQTANEPCDDRLILHADAPTFPITTTPPPSCSIKLGQTNNAP
ncbi:hypothetical protein NPIL_365441 [Nephila pilipes]|uniref:Uncharacterized protein n=1 Tax=Nephila pilipes TaxID=299642 RepID=A0A8X6NEK3_NEPPI|nr:hypothetical protein NPIL_365441 [Nephila pilipes]